MSRTLQALKDAASEARLAFINACKQAGYADEGEAYRADRDRCVGEPSTVWPEDLDQAHVRYLDALHTYYTARDGDKGFLGSRGL